MLSNFHARGHGFGIWFLGIIFFYLRLDSRYICVVIFFSHSFSFGIFNIVFFSPYLYLFPYLCACAWHDWCTHYEKFYSIIFLLFNMYTSCPRNDFTFFRETTKNTRTNTQNINSKYRMHTHCLSLTHTYTKICATQKMAWQINRNWRAFEIEAATAVWTARMAVKNTNWTWWDSEWAFG